MDCRSYKELLDSYLCQELAVETNHQMLNHTEHCASCRAEMASRRNMRETLRRACAKDCLGAEALERMRLQLRAESSPSKFSLGATVRNWLDWLTGFSNFRVFIPAASLVLVLAVGASLFLKLHSSRSDALQLSDLLVVEAADDHRKCASHFMSSTEPVRMSDWVAKYDQAYLDLDKIASSGAAGLTLRAAHVCKPDTRQFAHLVYTRGNNLISLLVTKRDDRALKTGQLPTLDEALPDLQEASNGKLSIGARQTSKHIVLVVSDLPQIENEKLAQTLVLPVVEHISKLDNQAANILDVEFRKLNLIASLRRREIQ
ncbi:MAG: hypothetical protein JST85_12340 [Acidobacteria bacterium]|nr:hypothetical protein [Acidobacteriota bacterium]